MSDLVHPMPVRAWDRNGMLSPGALARFYEPGTTTPRTVYTDSGLTIPHTLVGGALAADARGTFPPVYTSGPVKVIVTDADGVTLPGFPLDPAPGMAVTNAGASFVTFAPTDDIPSANVQDAIEQVDESWRAQRAADGVGLQANSAPLLANFDATNIPSGVLYRYDTATTIGSAPSGWQHGVFWVQRFDANAAFAFAVSFGASDLSMRPLLLGSWGAWDNSSGLVGAVQMFARPTAPDGWLVANGAAVSRTAYARLFAAIGGTYGAGDGSTTFNLPDLRGEFIRGWDGGRGVDSGRAFGSAQGQDIQSHSHSITYDNRGDAFGEGYVMSVTPGSQSRNTNAAGGTETRPRNIALLACIKY